MTNDVQETGTDVVTNDEYIVGDPDPILDLEFNEDDINMDNIE